MTVYLGIHIVRFKHEEIVRWGILHEGEVFPIDGEYESLAAFLKSGVDIARHMTIDAQQSLQLSQVECLSPVTAPTHIVCQGANYGAHREEAGLTADRPPFNLIFTKAPSTISGPFDDIIRPNHVKLLDYEIEIGLIIRKKIEQAVNVTKDNLHEYIAGFVITNDVSARDVQLTEGQWFKGKSYRTFCPVGPILYLIDEDEAGYIHNLELTLTVNGEVRQNAHTEQLLYKPEETLTSLSEMMDFYPGDLLLTGTPGGVALKLSPEELDLQLNAFAKHDEKMEKLVASQQINKDYLKDGDIVTAEVKSPDGKIHLGKQENKVVASNNY